jgi:hypothetical protein
MTATDHPHPTLMTRLAAAMHGEIAATTVEAYRRAGAAAYQDLLDAEQLRARPGRIRRQHVDRTPAPG